MRAVKFLVSETLMPGVQLSHNAEMVHVSFSPPHHTLSSAVLNGGYNQASDFLNVRVPKHTPNPVEDPTLTLKKMSDNLQCTGITVGMMTAASIDSLRVARETICGETLAVLVTSGLENARRAGDPAEYRSLEATPHDLGTINLGVIISARVAPEALVEMIAVATEAKVAVLHEMGVTSPISGALATGTGTDAIAIFSGSGDQYVRFAGKHTLLGERLASMVMEALRSSVMFKQGVSRCE